MARRSGALNGDAVAPHRIAGIGDGLAQKEVRSAAVDLISTDSPGYGQDSKRHGVALRGTVGNGLG